MNKKDWRDYLTYGFAVGIIGFASWYITEYHSDGAFGIWAGVVGSVVTVLRFLDLKDDKEKDSE